MKEQINNIRNALVIIELNIKSLEKAEKQVQINKIIPTDEIVTIAKKIKAQIDEQPIGAKFDPNFANTLFIDMGQLIYKILA
jgi:hypothetical protein